MANSRKNANKRPLLHERFHIPPDPPLNQDPVAMPCGYGTPKTLQEMLATMVREYVQMEKEEGFETWDEANDFEPEEDEDLLDVSPYTFSDLQEDEYETPSDAPETPISPSPEVEGDQPNPNAQEPSGLEPQNDLPEKG